MRKGWVGGRPGARDDKEGEEGAVVAPEYMFLQSHKHTQSMFQY